MSNRVTDSRGERAMSVFLDKYFYPKIKDMGEITSYRRIYEKKEQIKGTDIILNQTIRVDEKSQLYYINNPLKTFSFEINYLKKESNCYIDGWFVSKSNETQRYLLLWINEARIREINRLVSEDFYNVEAYFLEKKKVKAYIQKIGISNEYLMKKSNELRSSSLMRLNINKDFHLVLSKKLEEEPINLVISKSVLKELCESAYIIKKDSVKKI